MGASYSQDLRDRVLAAVDRGVGAYAVARLFGVSVSYIYKALIRRRTSGETRALPHAGGVAPKLAPCDEALRSRVAQEPDITLAELQEWLRADQGVTVSVGCLWNRLRHLGLTRKKSRGTPPSRTVRTSPGRAKNGVLAKPI